MVKTLSFVAPFKPGRLQVSNVLMLERELKSTIIGLAIGVIIGGDDAKCGKNTNLLVIMRLSL